MRLLKQPGPAGKPRRVVRPAVEGGQLRVVLAEGADLLLGLTAALAKRGIEQAAVQLSGGSFSEMQYLTGQPDESGERVATYGAPNRLEGPVRLIGGNAVLGRGADGTPLLHCHAVVVDREGRVHGGHLPPQACRVGESGLVAWVTVLAEGGFEVGYDAETNYDIFQPAGAAA